MSSDFLKWETHYVGISCWALTHDLLGLGLPRARVIGVYCYLNPWIEDVVSLF